MIFNQVMSTGLGSLPQFSYSGQFQLIDDGKNGSRRNWRIRFLTSGVLTFDRISTPIDVFLVGGGGGNGNTEGVVDKSGSGGGGYTLTRRDEVVSAGVDYEIIVGAGSGMPSSSSGTTQGGSTTAFGYEVKGGYSGYKNSGGDGGSGGADASGTNKAINGADGEDTEQSAGHSGEGQGSSTREFSEPDGELYASGGAQGSGDGAPNTGDGGGGTDVAGTGTSGGSGIVVIRNARSAA